MPADPSRVKVTGPLVPYVAGFRAELEAQGYKRNPVADQLRLLAHLSRWMEVRGVSLDQLGPGRVDEFLAVRRKAGYTLWLSRKALVPLFNYLEGVGARPATVEVPAPRPSDAVMGRYRSYLLTERGLGQESAAAYLRVARSFLGTRPQVATLGLSELSGADVVGFVRKECASRSVKSSQFVVTALRSLLRFLYLEGTITVALHEAVPGVAGWKLVTLPKAMSAGQVAALLASCDRRTTVGRRDFAVLIVLVRLGLRSAEVAALCLDDIDWRAGELVVRGKGPKQARLPLPADVGEALAAWLRQGRPRCAGREVFTRVHAPHRRLTSGGIFAIVAAAGERAGVPRSGPHRLRHTAATQMLAGGASLPEVGQVLRH
jgi:integrase/recombinase XerD